MNSQKICSKCNGKKHVFKEGQGWVACDCLYEARADRILKLGEFPQRVLTLQLSDFKETPLVTQKLVKELKNQMNEFNPSKIYFFYSPKLAALEAAALSIRVLIQGKVDIKSSRYISLGDLGDDYFSKETNILPEIENTDILVLEVGDEMTNSVHISILFSLLKKRLNNNKLTMLVSSINSLALKKVYKDKVSGFIDTYALKFEF